MDTTAISSLPDFDADLVASRERDIHQCKTVCLALGPYRNLTTLTAATLFLHPNCQVLNHAGRRVYGNDEVDFLSAYTQQKFDRFIQFAIQLSIHGTRGDAGGSITHSHAFDAQHDMHQVFREAGGDLIKPQIVSLFWKESLATSNRIRNEAIDVSLLLKAEPRLRFLMPVRHPLDCAVSNLRTGHAARFRGLTDHASITQVLLAILDEIVWFTLQKEKYPDRFFNYFEHSITRPMLIALCSFLGLEPREDWVARALSVMVSKSSYRHDETLVTFYRRAVNERFAAFPDVRTQLLDFVDF